MEPITFWRRGGGCVNVTRYCPSMVAWGYVGSSHSSNTRKPSDSAYQFWQPASKLYASFKMCRCPVERRQVRHMRVGQPDSATAFWHILVLLVLSSQAANELEDLEAVFDRHTWRHLHCLRGLCLRLSPYLWGCQAHRTVKYPLGEFTVHDTDPHNFLVSRLLLLPLLPPSFHLYYPNFL